MPLLAQCLPGTLMDETPFPVPCEALWSHFPVSVERDVKTTAALDRVDSQAFHDELTCTRESAGKILSRFENTVTKIVRGLTRGVGAWHLFTKRGGLFHIELVDKSNEGVNVAHRGHSANACANYACNLPGIYVCFGTTSEASYPRRQSVMSFLEA